MKKMISKTLYLSGYELFAIKKALNSKLLISEEDGNFVQRDFNEWDKDRQKKYEKSIKQNFHHNPIYIIDWNNKWYVVDGQHRLNYIIRAVNENFGKNHDDVISNNLFEIIMIEFKGNKEKFIEYASEIFLTLNNTSDNIATGSLFKSYLNHENFKESKKNIEKMKGIFKKYNTNNSKTDWMYEIIGFSIFLSKKENIRKIKNIKNDAITFFENNNNKFGEEIKRMGEFLDFLSKEKIYANNKNSEKFQKPVPHIFYIMFLLFAENKKRKIIVIKEGFAEITKHEKWKESKNNTRTPDAIYYKLKIAEKVDANKTFIEQMEEIINEINL